VCSMLRTEQSYSRRRHRKLCRSAALDETSVDKRNSTTFMFWISVHGQSIGSLNLCWCTDSTATTLFRSLHAAAAAAEGGLQLHTVSIGYASPTTSFDIVFEQLQGISSLRTLLLVSMHSCPRRQQQPCCG